MITYANFGIDCSSDDSNLMEAYNEFRARLSDFCVDDDMQLYQIPIDSDEYKYARRFAIEYPVNDHNDANDIPYMYVTESESTYTEYDELDYNKASAYLINFWYFAYDYDDMSSDEFVGFCCDKPSWRIEKCTVQNRNYMIPKSEFGRKKYAKLMLGYAASDEVRKLLIEEGLATDNDFREVTTKNGSHVCYQITPTNKITGFLDYNNGKVVDCCANCGMKRYNPVSEPYYISEELCEQLNGLNCTTEMEGPIVENEDIDYDDELSTSLEPLYIVNKTVYELLKKHYPRMQFIPILPGDE